MLKLSLLFFIVANFFQLYALDVTVVTKDVDYKEILSKEFFVKARVNEVKKLCKPVSYDELVNNKYIAKRYLKENSIICTRDIEKYDKKSVVFNFGTIQIERYGKIIFENDEYIRIKGDDGKVEKIYKDGRIE